MHAPIIWIRRRPARRLIHRFPGAAGGRQILVITPDRQEARDTAAGHAGTPGDATAGPRRRRP